MSRSNFDCWLHGYEDYEKISYSNKDMWEAYNHGRKYYEETTNLEQELAAYKTLFDAKRRVEGSEFLDFVDEFNKTYKNDTETNIT